MSAREELLSRHKKEQRDLVATVTGLKKQATKKTRRNVVTRCAELERDLEIRQKQEIEEFDGEEKSLGGNGLDEEAGKHESELSPEELLRKMQISVEETQGETEDVGASATQEKAPKQKRNRQKERLAKRNAEIERIKEEASKEAESQVDYRKLEQESMASLLQIHGLQMHEIQPDGHCLFASIRDQLIERHSVEESIADLRLKAGEYMKSHPDEFVPFLFNENTGELEELVPYVTKLTTTTMWGSDMEILALANYFDCPISVYIAGSSKLKFNENGSQPELKLGYLKHSYALGEHYNSLREL